MIQTRTKNGVFFLVFSLFSFSFALASILYKGNKLLVNKNEYYKIKIISNALKITASYDVKSSMVDGMVLRLT